MKFDWLHITKRLQSIAQAGLEYGADKYDLERYQMIRDISVEIMQHFTDTPTEKIIELFASETGYQTPKVDVRGVVFRNDKILMVKEGVDEKWTLPGGWADVGYSPFEIAEKEVQEEAGLLVKPIRLLMVADKLKHAHPPDAYHVYKLFILCEDLGGEIASGMETLDVKWVSRDERMPLSIPRITQEQIHLMFEYLDDPEKEVLCD
jgi:ADP-ribose pyrophosphatase YjhB (NUDIX family)